MADIFDFTAYLPTGAIDIRKIAGTIQEVLIQLANLGITMNKVVKDSWYDDGTNLEIVVMS